MKYDEDRVYFDTNLYLAYFFGENNSLQHNSYYKITNELKQFQKSKMYFETYSKTFFSNLLAIEIFSSIRKILSKNSIYTKVNELNIKSNELFKQIIGRVSRQQNFIFEQNPNNSISFNKIIIESNKIISSVKGTFKHLNHCNTCGKYAHHEEYKCLDIMDIMHVVIAKEVGCKKFITFDQYFNEIKYYDEIKPVIVETL